MSVLDRKYIRSGGMISAQGEAQDRKYARYLGKSGRMWFVYDNNPSHVLVTAYSDYDRAGEGFGGRTLHVQLEEGYEYEGESTFLLRGGWHANSEAMFEDTGVDIRDRYMTTVNVSLDTGSSGPPYYDRWMERFVHREDDPVMGSYDRDKEIGQTMADRYGVPVFVSKQSHGGGVDYWAYPEGRKSGEWDFKAKAWKT